MQLKKQAKEIEEGKLIAIEFFSYIESSDFKFAAELMLSKIPLNVKMLTSVLHNVYLKGEVAGLKTVSERDKE